jgi:ribosome-associated protein
MPERSKGLKKEAFERAQKIYDIIEKKKLKSIQILDVHELTSLADTFIIVTTSNTRQTKAIVDELEMRLAREDIYVRAIEGYQSALWILLDFGDIIVHVLSEEEATFYGLDRLWKDAVEIVF